MKLKVSHGIDYLVFIEKIFYFNKFVTNKMNENEFYVVKEYKFDTPLLHKIDSIIVGCYRDCHSKYFHTFKYVCIYDIKLSKITNNEIIKLSISDESMNLFELNKKLTLARQRGFRFLQINKLTIKIYSQQ